MDDEGNDVLLPNRYVPAGAKIGDILKVFVYKDSEDRLICTTTVPLVQLNQFAYLRAKDVNKFGAFMDWGLEKDLMVPYKEQLQRMVAGKSYLIHLFLDPKSDRLVATAKLKKHFKNDELNLSELEEVDLLIGNENEFGYTVVVKGRFQGQIYHNEIFTDILPGDRIKGFVKKIREDNKLDISLQKVGLVQLEDAAAIVYEQLKENDGFLSLHDKSDPSDIQFQLEMSKKNFKRAIGILYKKRLIEIQEDGIKLVK